MARYPADTIFFVQAWTYGYEDVWIALANGIDSKVSCAPEGLHLPYLKCVRC